MVLFTSLFLIGVVGAAGLAAAIQYFLRPGPWHALGYAFLAMAVFLIFAASGLWDTPGRHDWGSLTTVFAIMLISGFISIKFGKRLWDLLKKNLK